MKISDLINDAGWVILNNDNDKECARLRYNKVGKPLQIPGQKLVSIIRPNRKLTSKENTYSGIFGMNEFPLHSDLANWYTPPRYLALRGVVSKEGAFTHLLDSRSILNTFPKSELSRFLVRPRRPVNFQLPIYKIYEPRFEGFRWDPVFLEPASNTHKSNFKDLRKYITSQRVEKICLKTNDVLIIDNYRMLHGRSAVSPDSRGRVVERVFLGEILL
jgi:alpha-ketoglutarate-dependent taurine dioxygenase